MQRSYAEGELRTRAVQTLGAGVSEADPRPARDQAAPWRRGAARAGAEACDLWMARMTWRDVARAGTTGLPVPLSCPPCRAALPFFCGLDTARMPLPLPTVKLRSESRDPAVGKSISIALVDVAPLRARAHAAAIDNGRESYVTDMLLAAQYSLAECAHPRHAHA